MPPLATTYNFKAERGSVLDKTWVWDAPVLYTEDFTADGSTDVFTVAHDIIIAKSTSKDGSMTRTSLCNVFKNGAEEKSFYTQDDKVYLTSTPESGDVIRIEYLSSNLVNLTGISAKMQIRDAAGVLLSELSTANGKITFPSLGNIRILVPVAETELWPVGVYFYDLELTSGASYTYRLIEGKITVKRNITV